MRARRKVIVAAVAAALVVAGAAGAARMGVLTIGVGGGSHAAATGIQVHGRWNLVVRAKNGRVVARRRFENSLTSNGASILMRLISGAGTLVGGIGVIIDGTSSLGEGCQALPPQSEYVAGGALNQCWLYNFFCFNCQGSGLSAELSTAPTLTLMGHVTPAASTTIPKVETVLKECIEPTYDECDSETASAGFDGWKDFTSKTLSPALNVAAGQTVDVTVQISFS